MGNQPFQRRLAAILAADVAGYTRLMELDTDGTVAAWQAAQQEVIKPTVADHSGKIVKLTGDGFLVEFSSVQDAVNCAIAMQRGMASSSMDFRMGVNLGDIVDDGEDIHGEGVNVAARLEGMADPRGICISGDVYNQIRNRVDAIFEDRGLQYVKNVSAPVQVYAVRMDGSVAPSASAVPALPDKPSIAVLPFENMSADPEQEFFADGITEDLLTKLTNILGLFVIARNSTFRYKGTAVDVRRVAEELGVRYVLEGSVRKAGSRVRVTAQLIEAAKSSHLWAACFDRELTDIFAVQDEITDNVVQALQVTLLEGEQARIWHRSTENVEAWSCLTRGKAHYDDHQAVEESRTGVALLERAVELDPDYASAWTYLGWLLVHEVRYFWTDDPIGIMARVAECADKALALDEGLAEAYMLLAFVQLLEGEHDKAIATAERGVALGPRNADVVANLAFILNWVGRPEEALTWLKKAMRFSPFYPSWFVGAKAHALRLLGRFDEAVEAYGAAISNTPAYLAPNVGLTACYVEMGRQAEARESARKLLELVPKFSIERCSRTPGYKDRALNEHFSQALREAGLPE